MFFLSFSIKTVVYCHLYYDRLFNLLKHVKEYNKRGGKSPAQKTLSTTVHHLAEPRSLKPTSTHIENIKINEKEKRNFVNTKVCVVVNSFLLQRNEARRVAGANTGAAVEHGVVGHGELTEVAADHLTLDLNVTEEVTVVDADDGTDHLGGDDHITEVGADGLGLLTNLDVLLGLAEALQENRGAAVGVAVHVAAGTGVHDGLELSLAQGKKGVDLKSTVGELVEGTLLLELGVGGLIHVFSHLVCELNDKQKWKREMWLITKAYL
ncbi:small subunit ribosomal protein S15e [Angomonas deanei]|nr:small subunit ribosomal protein S15e [Angomonas deanei]|eukprot:EPY39590.1 small subunit ribosomal protein S15e [Angomonas deanei]